ncbi:MAG TPA: RNA polymerase sigma factor [Chitinophagaceae bacterium]
MDNKKELIKECLLGNRAMQNKLYAEFASTMMALCLRYAKNRHDAEEILQEGFIKVYACLHQYQFKGPLDAWIKKIMVNCALQKLKNKKPLYQIVHSEDTNEEFADEDMILDNIHAKELILMIQALPQMCRIIFNLYVFEGMKHREIARLLNISEGTSKSHLHDARRFLQNKLQRQFIVLNINSGA